MGFQGVCRALYDYAPQAEGELTITEGDLLYMLDTNSDDGWWKAKKKANTDDGDEPVGLVPNNYVEEAEPVAKARALYEYTRQTDEELSFPEDAILVVYDTSDEDWILVGLDEDFGFVPANYIEMADDSTGEPAAAPAAPPLPPSLPSRPPVVASESDDYAETRSPASPAQPASPPADNPAAALAGVMGGRSVAPPPRAVASPPPMSPQSPQYRVSDEDEEEVRSPALPARPASQVSAPPRPDSVQRQTYAADSSDDRSGPLRVPGGFHMYNINEMVSVMGKRKKMPTTLGINLGTATILIAPEKANDGPTQEWTADKMTHYSREGKHVFMELVRPSKSIDFHAGAKDTAEEIVGALGELAGAIRAAGLQELIMAGTSKQQKKGSVLYDFMAQGDDEVTVAVGDEVLIIDDAKSEEWWQVRRLRNGKEGVVPSSYIEITGAVTPPPSSSSGANAGLSTVEQNRLEEIRLTKEAMKAARQEPQQQQVGPGMPLPKRASSLQARDSGNNSGQRSKRENGRSDTKSKPKPDSSKVRTWTDRTRSFSVEAQFLGLKDGKINLHKMNGVKIAVPIAKMSLEDLEYVESVTGISLDEDKPLSNVKKAQKAASDSRGASSASGSAEPAGASIEQPPQKPEYDWFQFFLDCEVPVGVCERYAQAFNRESMDESILPDVDASVLRNLGLREGDILKVMRHLDLRFGRNKKSKDANEGEEGEGGLFSGPGGALRNNTRKGRPAPAVQTNDVVDPKAFKADGDKSDEREASRSPAPEPNGKSSSGFDDDAWDVKPSKKAPEPAKAPAAEAPRQTAVPTGAMSELSLLTAPLEPTKTASPQPSQPSPVLGQPAPQAPQPTGATPGFFAANNQLPQQQQQQQRQRPVPPQVSGGQGSLPPPPARPGSAPQAAQPSGFMPPPMAPQMTGAYAGRVAPPGQSLEEMTQNRMQQQQHFAAMQQQQQLPPQQYSQMTGFPGHQQQLGPMQSYPTGMPQNHGQFMQPMMTGQMPPQQQSPSQFPQMQAQPTGYGGGQQFPPQQQQPFIPQPTGVNSYLPPALEPQRTGMPPMQPMQTGAMGQSQVPSPPQALQPQQTGPAPPVRFGVTGGPNRLTPQQTGRKANLSHATPDNPFGF